MIIYELLLNFLFFCWFILFIDIIFLSFLFKLDFNVPAGQIENLMKLPKEKKFTIYKTYLLNLNEEPAFVFIDSMKYLIDHMKRTRNQPNELIDLNTSSRTRLVQNNIRIIDDLKLALRIRPLR
jgi:hypothetical protein